MPCHDDSCTLSLESLPREGPAMASEAEDGDGLDDASVASKVKDTARYNPEGLDDSSISK